MTKFNFYFLFIFSCLIWITPVHAKDSFTQDYYASGISYYLAGQYSDAETSFAQATGYNARMAQALSAFQLNKLNRALGFFMQAILLADSDNQRFTALYNAATCYFLAGNYSAARNLFIDASRYNTTDNLSREFAELSDYLDRLVLANIARKNASTNQKRSERGNKTAPTDGFEFDDSINLRLEDNKIKDSKTLNYQALLINDQTLLNKLISTGIQAIALQNDSTTNNKPSFVDLNIAFEFSSLEHATFTPSAEMSKLWKRIFELEQGFPADLEQPEQIPGIRPW